MPINIKCAYDSEDYLTIGKKPYGYVYIEVVNKNHDDTLDSAIVCLDIEGIKNLHEMLDDYLRDIN